MKPDLRCDNDGDVIGAYRKLRMVALKAASRACDGPEMVLAYARQYVIWLETGEW